MPPKPATRPWYREYQVGHGQPGMVDPWAAVVISLTCALVPVLVGAAMYVVTSGLATVDDAHSASSAFGLLPPALFAGAMCAWLWRTTAVSRWVRAAVFILIAHAAIMALAWWLWRTYSSRILSGFARSPFVVDVPATTVALVAGVAVIVGAVLPRSRRDRARVPTWLSWLVVFALLHLVLLGLWLPLAASGWSSLLPEPHSLRFGLVEAVDGASRPNVFVLIALIPPTLLAVPLTVLAQLRPQRFVAVLCIFAVLLFIAVLVRLSADHADYVAYANLVHVLLADAMFCLACIVALGVAHWRALRRVSRELDLEPPWVQHGTIETAPDAAKEVGWVSYVSWLSGLRSRTAGFELRTERGLLHVPAGAQLVAPAPDWTTSADAGQTRPVLRAGDSVRVTGYVAPTGDGAYRSGGLPVPGTTGLVVTVPRADHETIWRDVLLVVWRPCVFYAVAATVVALPGVIALTLVD